MHLPKPVGRGRVDVLGGVLVTVATTAVLLVATLGPDRGWTTTPVLALIAVAVVSLVGYVLTERRAAEPITPLPMFRNGVFVISAVQFFLSTLVLFVAMLYVPLFLQTVRHASAFTAGLYVIPLLVGLVAATAVAEPLIAKTGHYKRYPVIGALLVSPSMACARLLGRLPRHRPDRGRDAGARAGRAGEAAGGTDARNRRRHGRSARVLIVSGRL